MAAKPSDLKEENDLIDLTGYVDAHLHMAEPSFKKGYPDIDKAKHLFSCVAEDVEWNRMETIALNDDRVVPFYGIHPWYAETYSDSMRRLERILKNNDNACIGEIGLDENYPDIDMQISAFVEQLRMAADYDRPVTVHMVRTEKDVLETMCSVRSVTAILHSFSSLSYVKPFATIGCYFSVSPRLIMKSPEKVKKIIDAIPKDRLLIETDAPHCYNICSMSEFISKLSEITSIEPRELIDQTAENAERLIS